MHVLGTILLFAYGLAWLAVFYIPALPDSPLRTMAWIPAAVCALVVPMIVADRVLETPFVFLGVCR